jgi:hypothetical protein
MIRKEKNSKFNRCGRPSECQTAPNSGTRWDINKGFEVFSNREVKWVGRGTSFLLWHVSKEDRTTPK